MSQLAIIRKRTKEQIEQDSMFVFNLITEDQYISSANVAKLLNEHIANRGDDYSLDYSYIWTLYNRAKKEIIGFLYYNKEERAKEVHQRIQDNILIASDRVFQTLQPRQVEHVEIEEIGVKDLKDLTVKQVAFIESITPRFYRRKIRLQKLLPGDGLYEAMVALAMWVKAERDLLGLDAPKRIEKKTQKQITKETFDYTAYVTKMKDLGYENPERILELLQPKRNEKG